MRALTWPACFLVLSLLAARSFAQANGPPAAPKSLLIFYGWPSLINGSEGNPALAVKEFDRYDIAVIGEGLQDPKHGDHARTRTIIKGSKAKFFGYIDLGVTTTNLPLPRISEMLKQWKEMGVVGVLLDEFGFDYKVSRDRQNAAVAAAHELNLRVIANAWNPEDAFADVNGKPPLLAATDIYLWESYRYQEGAVVPIKEWRKKAEKIEELRKTRKFEVFSVSTTKTKPDNLQTLFTHQWLSAVIDGHDATGWGHPI